MFREDVLEERRLVWAETGEHSGKRAGRGLCAPSIPGLARECHVCARPHDTHGVEWKPTVQAEH